LYCMRSAQIMLKQWFNRIQYKIGSMFETDLTLMTRREEDICYFDCIGLEIF